MPIRVVFLGSDSIALPLLSALSGKREAGSGQRVESGQQATLLRSAASQGTAFNIQHSTFNRAAEVVGVFTQPDRPVGRGQKVAANAIKAWGLGNGVPVFQPERLGEAEVEQLRGLKPDLALVMAYGHILRDEFINVSRLGTLNLHASILPKYRGASPIQAAIASGEKETGVSLMRIVRKLDAGPVADVERVPVDPLDTALEIETKLAAACIPLLERNLDRLAAGDLTFVQQDERFVSHCRKLKKEDGQLDFHAGAAVLAARVNAFHPWPRSSVTIDGITLGFGLADTIVAEAFVRDPSLRPGTVVGSDPSGLLVVTGAGILRLRRLQRSGGKMLEAAEFLRGFPIAAGTVLPSAPMSELVTPS